MKEIGGYFELELSCETKKFLHSDGILVNSGRHAFEAILRSLKNKINTIWIPYYTCDAMLEPIKRAGLSYKFYRINKNLEITSLPELAEKEAIVVNNYFGIKDRYIKELVKSNPDKYIVDQSQAWYCREIPGIKAFYSPRKFFGIPDGGVAYGIPYPKDINTDTSWDRCQHLLMRHDCVAEKGYKYFKTNSENFQSAPIKGMSFLTRKLLASIDMEAVKRRRIENYNFLDENLSNINEFNLPSSDSFECGMVYPFYSTDASLRKKLIDNKVFVATYWPNVFEWVKPGNIEYDLAKNLIPLPIDQRYDPQDMERIIELILD